MINEIIKAYNAGKRVKLVLNSKEEIKLYDGLFSTTYSSFDRIEFDNDNIYLVRNAFFLFYEKTRIIPAKSILSVVVS